MLEPRVEAPLSHLPVHSATALLLSLRWWVVMLLLWLSGSWVSAQGTDKLTSGLMAYERGDYATAARLLEGLAAKDEPIPLMMLSSLYMEGRGVRRDPAKGFRLLHRAAQQNHGGALYKLSKMYAHGRYVPVDSAHAETLLLRAAQQGHPQAQFEIGQNLMATDPKTAVDWLRRAAARDHEEARQYFLAELVSAADSQHSPAPKQPSKKRPTSAPTAAGSAPKDSNQSSGPFEVQVGSFKAEKSALAHLAMLKRTQAPLLEGLTGRIATYLIDDDSHGTRYRVRVGRWSSLAKATRFCEQLKAYEARSPCLALRRSKP